MTAPLIELKGVACGYGRKPVLSGIDFAMRKGELVALLGPNGVGKTTLFKTILRLLPPMAGTIYVQGEDVALWSARRFAKVVGYVPQVHTPPFPFSVMDVVVMGRIAHLGAFASPSRDDKAIAKHALEELSIGHLQNRVYTELSGGERQLVLVARALTQNPELLVLDEPTSNLDYGNQISVLEHVGRLAAKRGIGVIMTTHDPNQALRCASSVVAITRGGAVCVGSPAAQVTETYLFDTYKVRARVVALTIENATHSLCIPLRGKTERHLAAENGGRCSVP